MILKKVHSTLISGILKSHVHIRPCCCHLALWHNFHNLVLYRYIHIGLSLPLSLVSFRFHLTYVEILPLDNLTKAIRSFLLLSHSQSTGLSSSYQRILHTRRCVICIWKKTNKKEEKNNCQYSGFVRSSKNSW